MKDKMTDIEKLQKFWIVQYIKKPPTFKEFSRTVKAYIPKHKWQKILPFWMLKLFVKPTTFYNCFPKAIDGMCDDEGNLTFNMEMNYKNDL